jgi:hypothetical protein
MTWLSLVTTITLIAGFAGMGLLSLLGASLRVQGPSTTRQSANRRMLSTGACLCGAGVVLPFLAAGWRAASLFALGWLALGVLVGAMFATRVPTRVLGTMLFLSAALFAMVTLPPHQGTLDAVGAFVVAGLLLGWLTRVAARRIASEGQLH